MRKAIFGLILLAGLLTDPPVFGDFMIDETRIQDDNFSRFFSERWFNWVQNHIWKWETRLEKKEAAWLKNFAKTNTRLNLKTKDGWVRSFGFGVELKGEKFTEIHLMALPLHGKAPRAELLSLFPIKTAPKEISPSAHLGLYLKTEAKKKFLLVYDPEVDSKTIHIYSASESKWKAAGTIQLSTSDEARNPASPETLQVDKWTMAGEPVRYLFHGFYFEIQAVPPVVQDLEEKVRKGFNVRPGYTAWTNYQNMILFFP